MVVLVLLACWHFPTMLVVHACELGLHSELLVLMGIVVLCPQMVPGWEKVIQCFWRYSSVPEVEVSFWRTFSCSQPHQLWLQLEWKVPATLREEQSSF